jgi:N-acetylglucosamine kinase-like BadF-type ATPase
VAFFLGIDGGASKTSCAVGDETALLGKGMAAGSNIVRVGEQAAGRALREAIEQACAAARVGPRQISRTCVGAAGGARPESAGVIRRVIAEVVSGEIEVAGDMEVAFHAAFGEGPGVIVIAGTGSIAYGRNSYYRAARAGGWGPAISDEGSAYWIGRSAIAAALRAEDQGEDPALLQSMMKVWGVESRNQLILAAHASPPPDFAVLFPIVVSGAESGDPTARSLLIDAGAELSTLAKMVIRRLFGPSENVPLAMAGGVFGNSALVRQTFQNSLRSEYPEVLLNSKVVEPVLGALDMARKARQLATGTCDVS